MARIRSPNYPAIGLPEAIAKVKVVHEKEQHLAAPKVVIAKHLGYKGLNGSALKTLSALAKYGLIEEVASDKIKVSDLAISILHPRSQDEKTLAIKDAASRPVLFVEIASEWPNGTPSDDNLKAYLIRKAFAVDAVDRVIKSYRETIDLVAGIPGAYLGSTQDSVQNSKEVPAMQQLPQMPPPTRGHISPPPQSSPPPPMRVAFDGERIEVSAILTDSVAVDRLIKALQANKDLLPDREA